MARFRIHVESGVREIEAESAAEARAAFLRGAPPLVAEALAAEQRDGRSTAVVVVERKEE